MGTTKIFKDLKHLKHQDATPAVNLAQRFNASMLRDQDARNRPAHNNGRDTLQTLTYHQNLYYSDFHKRWLVPEEQPLVHNYPYSSCGYDFGTRCMFGLKCGFNKLREEHNMPPRSGHQTIGLVGLVGNGMSLCSINACMTFIVACLSLLRGQRSVLHLRESLRSLESDSLLAAMRRICAAQQEHEKDQTEHDSQHDPKRARIG